MAKRKSTRLRRSARKLPQSAREFYQSLMGPVPVDVWRACVTLYQSAARFTTPVSNPSEYKVQIEDKVFAFADNPMNRGMVALKEFLRDQPDVFPAVSARILAMTGGVLKEVRRREEFSKFFQTDAADGSWMISEALLDAFASAPFIEGTLSWDLQEMHRIASEILANEPDQA